MSQSAAEWIVFVVQSYVAVGFVFALAFTARGVSAIDPLARDTTWGFRLLIVPGTTLWWPLLAIRWLCGSMAPPVEVNRHRRLARRHR